MQPLYRLLEQQATAFGVRRLVVALDDPCLGRQYFASDRHEVGSSLALRCGATVWTEPAFVIPLDTERRLITEVRAALDQARKPRRPADGMELVQAAVARATRYGLPFTLVCVDAALPRGAMRPGDTLIPLPGAGSLLILEAAKDEQVPAILARLGARAALPPMTFGLVHCPGDGTDADQLVAEARHRLADARGLVEPQGQMTLRAAAVGGR